MLRRPFMGGPFLRGGHTDQRVTEDSRERLRYRRKHSTALLHHVPAIDAVLAPAPTVPVRAAFSRSRSDLECSWSGRRRPGGYAQRHRKYSRAAAWNAWTASPDGSNASSCRHRRRQSVAGLPFTASNCKRGATPTAKLSRQDVWKLRPGGSWPTYTVRMLENRVCARTLGWMGTKLASRQTPALSIRSTDHKRGALVVLVPALMLSFAIAMAVPCSSLLSSPLSPLLGCWTSMQQPEPPRQRAFLTRPYSSCSASSAPLSVL